MHGFYYGFKSGYPTDRLYYHATDEPTMGIAFALSNILPEVCQAVHAVWSCVYVTLNTFQAMILSIYFNLSY